MKRSAFVKYLRNQGCTIAREGGKHSIFKNNKNGKTTSVPRHSELFDNTCKEICKQLGITLITK
ncbi:MAG: type II toxin-antitoxin system HicA family toxin [bacterium]